METRLSGDVKLTVKTNQETDSAVRSTGSSSRGLILSTSMAVHKYLLLQRPKARFWPLWAKHAHKQNSPTHKKLKHQHSSGTQPRAEERQEAAHTLSVHPQAQYGTWPTACIEEQASGTAGLLLKVSPLISNSQHSSGWA